MVFGQMSLKINFCSKPNSAFQERNLVPAVEHGDGSVMRCQWRCQKCVRPSVERSKVEAVTGPCNMTITQGLTEN